MASIPQQPKRTSGGVARFGAFELNTGTGELRRLGRLVTLQDQQVVVLKYLVERAGATVTREELRTQIWPEGTYVEFETGLYNAINRLRRSLGDSASCPHFIETVPKEGYRFIAALEYQQTDDQVAVSLLSPQASSLDLGSEPAALPSNINLSRWLLLFFAAGALMLLCGVMGVVFWSLRSKPITRDQVYRYSISVAGVEGIVSFAISPGGDQIVFQGANGLLWRRYVDRSDPRPIPGSEEGLWPFFSPDGQSVGFVSGNSLKIVEHEHLRVLTATPQDTPDLIAVWGEDGFIYFHTRAAQGIWRIPARGGKPDLVVRSTYSGRGAVIPFANQLLTTPRHLLIYSTNSGPTRRSLRVRDLDTQLDKQIIARGIGGHILPDGELTYFSRGSLFAIPFDQQRLEVQGTPVEVVKDVSSNTWQSGLASISNTGTLAYVASGEPDLKILEWVDGGGRITPLALPPDQYEQAEVSPRGDLLAIVRRESAERSSLWTYELHREAWRHILGSDLPYLRAQWSPDQTALIVSSARQNEDFTNLYRVPLANPANSQRLTEQPDYGQFPLSWSAKANAVLFIEGVHERTNADLMVLPLSGSGKPKMLVATPGWDRSASFSPEGHSFVYESDQYGKPEIFVRAYNAAKTEATGPTLKISRDGGTDPLWAPDGRSIYYSDLSRRLVHVLLSQGEVPVSTRLVGVSVPGRKDYWTRTCSMAPDGRLLFISQIEQTRKPAELQVVLNWEAEIEQLSPLPRVEHLRN